MKKKMLAVVMAAAMMASLGSLAFAADTEVKPGAGQTGDTNVSYKVDSTYTVKIPSDMAYSESATSFTLTASGVKLEEGQTLKVTSDQLKNGTLTLKNGSKATGVNFTVKAGTDAIDADGLIKSFTSQAADQTVTLNLTPPASVDYAGTYSATVTFTVAVVDPTPAT